MKIARILAVVAVGTFLSTAGVQAADLCLPKTSSTRKPLNTKVLGV
jgi:hypothetical protein